MKPGEKLSQRLRDAPVALLVRVSPAGTPNRLTTNVYNDALNSGQSTS
jgi:hypothetical protein